MSDIYNNIYINNKLKSENFLRYLKLFEMALVIFY